MSFAYTAAGHIFLQIVIIDIAKPPSALVLNEFNVLKVPPVGKEASWQVMLTRQTICQYLQPKKIGKIPETLILSKKLELSKKL